MLPWGMALALHFRTMPPSARELLCRVQDTLKVCGIDYERTIREFGQVAAAESRANGTVFMLRDHVRGLLLSQLSNQRPWKRIADNQAEIRRIFFDYDPTALQHADPQDLEKAIRRISCGNRAIAKQMDALRTNIQTLVRIERDYGSLDRFVTSAEPDQVAMQISKPGPYKLWQLGSTLSLEYLRNVGIRAAKPDVHVRRILSGERLSYFSEYPTEQQAAFVLEELAREAECNATYFDNIVWLFCSVGYGNVCGASPRCHLCALHDKCRYPSRSVRG